MMNTPQPLVFVIVLNHGSYEDSLACIAAIRRSTYLNYRLFVVDNDSPDRSGSLLAQKLAPHEFMQLDQNYGYAGGNNIAIQSAMAQGAAYVLILNPDVRIHPQSIETYVDILQKDALIGALNSIQLCADGQTIDPHFAGGLLNPLGYKGLKIQDNDFPHRIEAESLFGAALMLSMQTIKKVGGFDPLFFAYGEEVDLCRRIKLHGLKLVITPDAPVLHLRHAQSHSDFILFLKLKGYMLFLLKAPDIVFLKNIRIVLGQLFKALLGFEVDAYPFSHCPLQRSHIARTLFWLTPRLILIWRHRAGDIKGRMYL